MKFFVYMKYYYLLCLLFVSSLSFAQTKAGGYVKDSRGEPVPFANVLFVNSSVGTITNDDGSFYIETEKSYDALQVSFLGFQTQTIPLEKSASLNLEIILEEVKRLCNMDKNKLQKVYESVLWKVEHNRNNMKNYKEDPLIERLKKKYPLVDGHSIFNGHKSF